MSREIMLSLSLVTAMAGMVALLAEHPMLT